MRKIRVFKRKVPKRDESYGSHAFGTLLGVNPWGGQHELYRQLVHGYSKPKTGRMELGLLMEGPLLKRYAQVTGATIKHPIKTVGWTYGKVMMRDTADGLVLDAEGKPIGALDAKITSWRQREHWEDAEGLPTIPEWLQTQGIMHCWAWSVEWCDFIVWFGDNDIEVFRQYADHRTALGLMELAYQFETNHVRLQSMPEVDNTPACQFNLNRGEKADWRELKRDEQADSDIMDTVERVLDIDAQIKKLNEERDLKRNQIRAGIGDNEGVTSGWFVAKNKENKKGQRVLRIKDLR